MKALLILPETGPASFLSNLIDRPFLRHTVDYLAEHGISEILMAGPSAEQAFALLGSGAQCDVAIEYCRTILAEDIADIFGDERFLLARADCLPHFPLEAYTQELMASESGATILSPVSSRPDDDTWTGWAIISPGDIASMPLPCDRDGMASWLETLSGYDRIAAEWEVRCSTPEEIWRAHIEVLTSNLAGIHHQSLEVKPGIWLARNASVAPGASMIAPVWVGENSQIAGGALIGPFAAVARDCLVSQGTTVRHAVLSPCTYTGDNLDLDHLLIDKSTLFDVRSGAAIGRVDPLLLDGVFDFHWSTLPGRICAFLSSAFLSCCAMIPGVLSAAWARLRSECVGTREVHPARGRSNLRPIGISSRQAARKGPQAAEVRARAASVSGSGKW